MLIDDYGARLILRRYWPRISVGAVLTRNKPSPGLAGQGLAECLLCFVLSGGRAVSTAVCMTLEYLNSTMYRSGERKSIS